MDPSPESQELLSLQMEWTYKTGKKKSQQFWVYCEDSQFNYLSISIQIPEFQPSRESCVLVLRDDPTTLILTENEPPLDQNLPFRGLCLNTSQSRLPQWQYCTPEEVTPFNVSELQLSIHLKSDMTYPLHPQQSRGTEVVVTKETVDRSQISAPFQYMYKLKFQNRAEGWFFLETGLLFHGALLFQGRTKLFMFNNPRMKEKKHLSQFSSEEIKFMQTFVLWEGDSSKWVDLGLKTGFSLEKTLQLCEKAKHFFKPLRKRPNNSTPTFEIIHYPASEFYPSSLPLPPQKKPRLNSNNAPISSQNKEELRFSPRHEEAEIFGADERAAGRFPVLFQWLSESGNTLLRPSFITVHVHKTIELDEFLRLVLAKRVGDQIGPVRSVFCLRGDVVTEIRDSLDLHSLFSQNSFPKLLLASFECPPPPPELFQQSSLENRIPIHGSQVASTNTGSFEFTFTIRVNDEIREIYIPSKTLNAFRTAVAQELLVDISKISKLVKSSTGARLTNDKNLNKLTENEIVDIVLSE